MGDNVREIRPQHGIASRSIEELTLERFCLADAGGEWLTRSHLPNGMIILTYPRCVMHCSRGGEATLVKYSGFDAEPYFDAILLALDEVA